MSATDVPLPIESAEEEPRPLDALFVVGCSWATLAVANVVFIAWMLVVMFTQPKGTTLPSPLEIIPAPVLLSATFVDAVVTVAALWLFVAYRRGKTFSEALAIRPVALPILLFSIALGITTAGLATLLPSSGTSMMDKLVGKPGGLWILCVLAVTIAPVEELYYRGLILPVLTRLGRALSRMLFDAFDATPGVALRASRWIGATVAIAFVSLWFGALHGPQLWPDWIGAVYITAMGTIWTLQRHFTGSLVPSLISHWLHNALLMAIVVTSMITDVS